MGAKSVKPTHSYTYTLLHATVGGWGGSLLAPSPTASVAMAAAAAARVQPGLGEKDKSMNTSVIRNMPWLSACRIRPVLRARAPRLMINYEDLGLFIALIFPAAPAHILLP